MSKKIKKAFLAAAVAAVVGVSAAASACTIQSKHPNARITIEFNEETFVIDYTLYRNMYPQTVQHFIELVDSGFYNDTIIHDYRSSDWVTGGYSYNAKDDEGNVMNDYVASFSPSVNNSSSMPEYLEKNSKEEEYFNLVTEGIKSGTFSASVYKQSVYEGEKEVVALDDALPTLIGEFSENGHNIKDDKGLKSTFGALKTFYYSKDNKDVVIVENSFGQILPRNYSYNSTTSLFSMQVSNSSLYDSSKYAVFGQLKNDGAKDALEDLIDAISDHVTNSSYTNWTKSIETQVDQFDLLADEKAATFTMVAAPIIIRSVKITKY